MEMKAAHTARILQQLSYGGAHPCPSDVFVIPCSVPGVSYDLLSSVTLIVLQVLHTIPCTVTQFKTKLKVGDTVHDMLDLADRPLSFHHLQ